MKANIDNKKSVNAINACPSVKFNMYRLIGERNFGLNSKSFQLCNILHFTEDFQVRFHIWGKEYP